MRITRIVARTFSISMMMLGTGMVFAQEYPNKTIRIVTSGAGGSPDFVARLIAPGISGPLGQPVVVENRGAGVIPVEFVSKSAPDGYTLLSLSGSFYIVPLLQKAPYDPIKDFSPVTLVTQEPNILVVHASLPVKSVNELIALAKARPGELNYSSGSTGGTSHLTGELFKALTGVNIVRISYKSDAVQTADLLGGQVQLTFGKFEQVMPHVKAGKLRALAVTSPRPSALLPSLPTVAASVPGFQSVTQNGIFAPAKTPAAIINRLNQEITQFISQPDAKAKFFSAGQETVGSSPEELAAAMKSYMGTMGKVIANAGIKAD